MNPENTTAPNPTTPLTSTPPQTPAAPTPPTTSNQGKSKKGLIFGAVVIIVLALLALGYIKLKPSTPRPVVDTHVSRTRSTPSTTTSSPEPQASPIVVNNSEELEQTLNQVKNLDPKSLNSTIQQNQSDSSQFSQ